jgi:hypothetical protein
LEKRTGKLGLGTAYIHGFKWAISKNYDYVFEMDCDFSHNPKDLVKLYQACKNGADVSIGSRYVSGGKVKNWPIGRILMSYFASVYVRLVLFINIKDTTAGFKCYRRNVLESIDFDKIIFKKLDTPVIEVPITFNLTPILFNCSTILFLWFNTSCKVAASGQTSEVKLYWSIRLSTDGCKISGILDPRFKSKIGNLAEPFGFKSSGSEFNNMFISIPLITKFYLF